MDVNELRKRLEQLEALHQTLGRDLQDLKAMMTKHETAAVQVSKPEPPRTPEQSDDADAALRQAKQALLEGYDVAKHGGNEHDLLCSLIVRILEGEAKGMKDSKLAEARLVASDMIERVGLRAGTRFGGNKLGKLFTKNIPFTKITRISRDPL